jgi:hypothetical protein
LKEEELWGETKIGREEMCGGILRSVRWWRVGLKTVIME